MASVAVRPNSPEEATIVNASFFEKIGSNDPMQVKQAQDTVNAFTKVQMREESFWDKILPPIELPNEEIDRVHWTDKPIKVVDKEPGNPPAISVPFATQPINFYIRGPRYLVMSERILSPRFTKDVDELRTYIMDIRQVLSDNSVKDMGAEVDAKAIRAVETAVGGAVGAVPATSGVVQWQQIPGGISRDSLVDHLNIMPRTWSAFESHTHLTNMVTIKEIWKFGRDEQGGDLAQDIVLNGWSRQKYLDREWIVTIKRWIVPDGRVYQFGSPDTIGKHYDFEPQTMYIRREAFMLEFYCYMLRGCTLGNTTALAIVDFI